MFPEFRRETIRNPVGRASPPHERTAMNLTRWTNLLILGLMLSFAAVGCKTNPQGMERIHGYRTPKVGDDSGMSLRPFNPEKDGGLYPLNTNDIHANWPENPTIFKPYTVHFEYDSTVLRSSDKAHVS